ATETHANQITPRGDIVGLYIDSQGVTHGFLLTDGDFSSVDVPDSIETTADGTNARGDIVGRYTDLNHVTHGYLLSDGDFTSIDVPVAIDTRAYAINPVVTLSEFTGMPTMSVMAFC